MKKILAVMLLIMALGVSFVSAAVPSELDCDPFENETTSICTDLDQLGTGISLMTFKLNLGLPVFLLGLAIIGIVVGIAFAVVALIKSAMNNALPGKNRR